MFFDAEDIDHLKAKIWQYTEIDPETMCWNWTGCPSQQYGSLRYKRKNLRVNRLAYAVFLGRGRINKKMHACHTCDNMRCVNPGHIFLGTAKDNVHDMIAKGRRPPSNFMNGFKGIAHGRAKLTEEQVLEIRNRAARGETGAALSREFGIAECTTNSLIRRVTWKHI